MSRIVNIVSLYILLSDARKLDNGMRQIYWNEIEEDGEARKTKELYKPVEFLTRSNRFDDDRDDKLNRIQTLQTLPPAAMARYVVNQADWAAIATISTRRDVQSFPMSSLVSIADGPVGNGTGMPYMYLISLDFATEDLAQDHRATLLVTLAEGNYCKNTGYDAMDPRCVRVMLTGKIKAVKNGTKEYDVVNQLYFDRHLALKNQVPRDHNSYFAKLEIYAIAMLDSIGGQKFIPVEDYWNPPIPRRNSPHHERIAFSFIFESVD